MVRLFSLVFVCVVGWLQASPSVPNANRSGVGPASGNVPTASVSAVERRGLVSRAGQLVSRNSGVAAAGGLAGLGLGFYLTRKDKNGVRRIDRWCETVLDWLGYEDSETSSDSGQEESETDMLAPDGAARLLSFKKDLIGFLNVVGGRDAYPETYNDIVHRIGNARTVEEADALFPVIENFSKRCRQEKEQQDALQHRRILEDFERRKKQEHIDHDYALALHINEFHDGEQ